MSSNLPNRAIWTALSTTHQPLSLVRTRARRYPAAVAPFAALEDHSPHALEDLRQLLAPGESLFLEGEPPQAHPGLEFAGAIPCLQMTFPDTAALDPNRITASVEPLTCGNAAEMLDLIAVAYPGYFRPETCRMGQYFGVRDQSGRLVSMGGERLCLQEPGSVPWREISALCTHPDHAGKGLGTTLLWHLLAAHRAVGVRSWLWVAEANRKAFDLYVRVGFILSRSTQLYRLQRTAE